MCLVRPHELASNHQTWAPSPATAPTELPGPLGEAGSSSVKSTPWKVVWGLRSRQLCLFFHCQSPPGPSPGCCDLVWSFGGLVLLSALWIIHGKGGEPPRSLRVPSLEVFLSCSEIWEVLGPSCPHVHLQWHHLCAWPLTAPPARMGVGHGCS